MATITAEDRTALTNSLHRLLADKCTEADVRRTMETRRGLRSGALGGSWPRWASSGWSSTRNTAASAPGRWSWSG